MARHVITEKTRKPVLWLSDDGFKHEGYFSIEIFDCHIVSLNRSEEGGGFLTVIPISDLKYRLEHPTKAHVVIENVDDYVEFNIYDDWGSKHTMKIPNRMKREIRFAQQSAVDLGLI